MKQNVTCPYMDSGCCTRHGCIYLPNQNCLTVKELHERIKIAKKLKMMKKSKNNKMSFKRAKRGNKR